MPADLREGSELAGYRIQILVARGGMGVVYRATQLSLERQVALKVVAPDLSEEEEFRARFLREARVAASLDHPHVLPVYEAGEADGVLYLAMRFVEGESLAQVIAREGSLEPARALSIVTQVAEALEAAHSAGLVHRDVKPANVLLAHSSAREHAYLCDFGVARRSQAATALTKTGGFVGSVVYAAPEQIKGEPVDARTDLYALGCLLYECLTGEPPFPREHEAAVLWAHLNEPPPVPSLTCAEVGESFDAIVERALAKDPADRFQSDAEFGAALSGEAPLARRRGSAPTRTNLPTPVTSFLGRERELEEVLELLLQEDVRLLTLTGTGGTGKTRLALRAGEEAAPAFRDGVYWVGLASLRDPALVRETISQTLEAKQELAVHIADKRLLMLLDNFEHVVDAAPTLMELLSACPGLTILVTSRQTLRVAAEREYIVPELVEGEAVALFCERARLPESDTIAEICRRLDGMPLALELAAARTKLFTPEQLLERLGQRLDLLRGGRDADPRQQTLRATLEWSHDLLENEEQALFARMSVFAGGCTFEAAEEVCGADPDTLQSLLEKNLLRRRDTDLGPRYSMLETIREFARERLDATRRADDVLESHAHFFLALAERLEPHPIGSSDDASAAPLLAETDNLRAAIEFLAQLADPTYELRLVGSLFRLWETVGLVGEGGRLAERALTRASDDPALRAKVLYTAFLCALYRADFTEANRYAEERLSIARDLADVRTEAIALNDLGVLAQESGDFDKAASLYETSAELARKAGDEATLLALSLNLGVLALERHDYVQAKRHFEALLAQEQLDTRGRALALENLGLTLLALGEMKLAAERFLESLALAPPSLLIYSNCLDGLAAVAVAAQNGVAAARLAGAAKAIRTVGGVEAQRVEQEVVERTEAAVRTLLGDEQWRAERTRGEAMSLDRAVAYACELAESLMANLPDVRTGLPWARAKINLPTPASSFLGRGRELQEVLEVLLDEDVRLLALTGPGGTGKTRLALRAGEEAAPAFPDGVYWVGLASLRDAALVTETIAQTLEAKQELAEHIADKRLLLLLDNFEQVVEAAPSLASLLQACPKLTLLVTSRELLRLQAEVEYAVPPLAEPEAVDLFCARSRLEPSEEIAELCARLDSLPLAVELAAGRTTLFSPVQILDRLSARLDLLKGGRDADPRQQTLRATIEWSYDLLSDEEKQLFARLGVFAGGCTFEAAEEVADADPDTLQSLLEKNLLRRRDTELGPRYWMLETIHDFARGRLVESGEPNDVSQRHADWVLRLSARVEEERYGSEQLRWRATLELEQDNVRVALGWMEEMGLIDAQLELVGNTFMFWYIRGNWHEGGRWAEAALSRSEGETSVNRAKALNAAAGYAERLGDFARTRAYSEESLSISRQAGVSREIAWALICLGIVAAELDGDYELAGTLLEEAATEAREAGDNWSLAIAIGDLGIAVSYQGDHARSIALTEEALVLFRGLESDADVAWALGNLADGLFETGREDEALVAARESLALSHAIEDVATRIAGISMLASIAAYRGDAESAATLFAAAEAFRERIGKVMERSTDKSYRTATEELVRTLGQERFEAAIAKGRAMSLDETVRFALEALPGS